MARYASVASTARRSARRPFPAQRKRSPAPGRAPPRRPRPPAYRWRPSRARRRSRSAPVPAPARRAPVEASRRRGQSGSYDLGRQIVDGRQRARASVLRRPRTTPPGQAPRDEQDVGEDDRRIEGEPAHGLQGRFRRHRRIMAKGDEIRRLARSSRYSGKRTPGLAHEPDRRALCRASPRMACTRRGSGRRIHGRPYTGLARRAQAPSCLPSLIRD